VDNQYFVLYVPTVRYFVFCDISDELIRQNVLYGTCCMGLFFEMRVSTSLILVFQSPIMLYSLQAVCIYGITFSKFNVCNTWDTPQCIQQNGAVLSNNGYLAKSQKNINMYYR
jgi:hypothetical protein